MNLLNEGFGGLLVRLFIAINFTEYTRRQLAALRDELRSKARGGNYSRDENLHLTLAFIGEVSSQKLDAIKAVLDTVTFEPFEAMIDKLGTFSRGTLWWAGVRKDKCLLDLQREVKRKLALCGIEMDGRDYHPHITLGREIVADAAPWKIEPFGETVNSIDMMKSERIDGKLTYTAIYRRNGEVIK
jgi:2'-5' RNA ligase